MPNKKPASAAPSQRQLRVAEEVRHALAAVLSRGDVRDPVLRDARLTVTEVRATPDLRHMTVFVSRLGQAADRALLDLLRKNAHDLRRAVARAVRLKFAPDLHFEPDTSLDYAMRIDALLKRPEVARDLAADDADRDEADDGAGRERAREG